MPLIWGFVEAKACNQIQNRAIRYFLGVHKFCPIPALNGDMGWSYCQDRRFICMLRFWNRLISLNDNRLLKFIFLWDYQLNKQNWSSEIRHICDSLDLTGYFDSKLHIPINFVKTKLCEINQNRWQVECHSKPKLRTYINFKQHYMTETYVKSYLSRQQRSLLAQFRTGILPLRLETGRFHNARDHTTGKIRKLAVHERTCLICYSDYVEDEFHFVFNCNKYSLPRLFLFQQISAIKPDFLFVSDVEKLNYMLNHQYKLFAHYLVDAWNIRAALMYISDDI